LQFLSESLCRIRFIRIHHFRTDFEADLTLPLAVIQELPPKDPFLLVARQDVRFK
jgi:hypothetical protein